MFVSSFLSSALASKKLCAAFSVPRVHYNATKKIITFPPWPPFHGVKRPMMEWIMAILEITLSPQHPALHLDTSFQP